MRRDRAAVAEDGQPIGDGTDLCHAMRDENDELALDCQLPCKLKQPICFAGRQGGRRFIQNEDARFLCQPLGDLNDLPLRQSQPPQLLIGAQPRKGIFVEQFYSLTTHDGAVYRLHQGHRFLTKPDVLLDRQIGDQRQFLENGSNTAGAGVVGIGRAEVPAVDQDHAAVVAHSAR